MVRLFTPIGCGMVFNYRAFLIKVHMEMIGSMSWFTPVYDGLVSKVVYHQRNGHYTRQRGTYQAEEEQPMFYVGNGLMAFTTLIAMVNAHSGSFLTADALAQWGIT